MTVTMNAIGTTGASAVIGIETAAPPSAARSTPGLDSLLPEPSTTVNTDMLMSLLVKSASDTRKIHSANRQLASKQREAAQQEEVDKLHEQANAALVTGVTSGAMQIGSAALEGMSSAAQNDAEMMKVRGGGEGAVNPDALKTSMDAAADYKLQGELMGALNGMNKATGDATGKDLEADAKFAGGRAGAAKDTYDNESDEMRAQRDLKDAIIKAYDALIGIKAQNAGAFLAPAQRA
ncbi:MAG: hypothetical protein JWP97_606 [Labilithrix sp.]|nr:hypothetical protein [Labilithrix sp.]